MSSAAAAVAASSAAMNAAKTQQQYQLLADYFLEKSKTSPESTLSADDIKKFIENNNLNFTKFWEKLPYIKVSEKSEYWIDKSEYFSYKQKYEKSINNAFAILIKIVIGIIIFTIIMYFITSWIK